MNHQIEIDGKIYTMGRLPRTAEVGSIVPVLSERIKTIPRSEWTDVDFEEFTPPTLDQANVSACNAFSACMTVMTCQKMSQAKHVDLWPGFLYGLINRGRDEGSILGDALRELMNTGCLPRIEGVKDYEWNPRIWRQLPNVKEKAAQNKVVEAYECTNFDEIMTALERGFLVNLGVEVGNNFTPNSEGICPDYRGGGGGHAICGIGKKQINGRWYVKIKNSWKASWGINGCAYIGESYFAKGIFQDNWAVRVVTTIDPEWRQIAV